MATLTERKTWWRSRSGQVGVSTTYYEGGREYGSAGVAPPKGAEEITERDLVILPVTKASLYEREWENREEARVLGVEQRIAEADAERQELIEGGLSPAVAERLVPRPMPYTPLALTDEQRRHVVGIWTQMYHLSPASAETLLEAIGVG